MEPVDPESSRGGQGDAQGRLEALRQLATQSGVETSPKQVEAAPHMSRLPARRNFSGSRWRLWLAVTVMVALVAVVLVSILYRATPAPVVHTPRPQAVVITPASESIACPVDIAWSPDLSEVAVMGYATSCPSIDPTYDTGVIDETSKIYDGTLAPSPNMTAIVAVYDTAHGSLVRRFSIREMILQALHTQGLIAPAYTAWLATVAASPDQYIGFNFTHVLWSHDRTHLYVTFTCFLPDGPPVTPKAGSRWPGHVAQGLVVTDVNGQHGQVYLHTSEPQAAGAVVWDLASGRVVGSMAPALPFAFQPTTTAFAWNGQGGLQPASALPATGAVGAPQSGSASFAVWQPGVVGTTVYAPPSERDNLTGVAVFATNIAALSPNGQYLAASLGLASLLIPPPSTATPAPFTAPGVATLASYGWQSVPRLPARDAGLQRAIALASQSGFGGANGDALTNLAAVAWRPDGRYIAVSVNTPTHAVFIFDCTTAKQAAALTPPVMDANTTNAVQNLIEWSPDGRRLAYFDLTSGTLTLWGSSFLPA